MGYSFSANNPLNSNNVFASFSTGQIAFSPANTTANSILFGIVGLASGTAITSVTDSAGNTWTVETGSDDGTWQLFGVSAPNPSAYSGSDYVHLNFTGGPSAVGCVTTFGELLGGPTSGLTVSLANATGMSTTPSANLTSLASGSAIVGYGINSSDATFTLGSGYAGGVSNNATYAWAAEDNLSSASGSVAVDFSLGSSVTRNVLGLAFSPGSTHPPASQMLMGAAKPLGLHPVVAGIMGAGAWVINRRDALRKRG